MRTGCEQFLRCANHRRDNAFRVAGTAAPNKFVVLARAKERWNRVHVRGERNERLTPGGQDIVAIGRGGNALNAAVVARGERRQMDKEVVAHIFFVVRGRLDVHERASEFEKIHSKSDISG